jgi:hypothetical protein
MNRSGSRHQPAFRGFQCTLMCHGWLLLPATCSDRRAALGVFGDCDSRLHRYGGDVEGPMAVCLASTSTYSKYLRPPECLLSTALCQHQHHIPTVAIISLSTNPGILPCLFSHQRTWATRSKISPQTMLGLKRQHQGSESPRTIRVCAPLVAQSTHKVPLTPAPSTCT